MDMEGATDRCAGRGRRRAACKIGKTSRLADAVARSPTAAVLMIGGFMGGGHVGTHRLVDELVRQGKKGLTVIANDTAKPGLGIGKLISARLVRA
jgi:acetate CoA/acetoacetate CoA-transferase alpha subunit